MVKELEKKLSIYIFYLGCYFLINQMQENQDDDSLQHITWSEKENAQMGLTFTILGLIFMSNGKVGNSCEEPIFFFILLFSRSLMILFSNF